MKEYSETQIEMQCPQCGSHSTQSVAIVYAQSARTGSAGYETVSDLGTQLAPPEERDEKFWPWIVVCVTATTALFKLPSFLDTLEIEALQNLSSLGWKNAGLSCVIGWFAGLCFAIPAIRYNLHVLPHLVAEWQKGMICSRCAHRWQRGDVHGVEITNHD